MISQTSLVLASHGFGLNTNLFETNIINLIIVITVLVWFLRGFVGGILQRRREAILVDLKDAEERLLLANRALELGQQELAQARPLYPSDAADESRGRDTGCLPSPTQKK